MDKIPLDVIAEIMKFDPCGIYKRSHAGHMKKLMNELLNHIHFDWWQKNARLIEYGCSLCNRQIAGQACGFHIVDAGKCILYYIVTPRNEEDAYTYNQDENEVLCSDCSFLENPL